MSESRDSNRPWPPPRSPWIMRQKWHDLLFMHWRVNPAGIRPLVPAGIELDTFDGAAWVGVVPFRMTGVRARLTPPIPGASAFPELNVRTYVTRDGKPGVWFFSLDATNTLAVIAARALFYLPYFRARMSLTRNSEGTIEYHSRRTHPGAPDAHLRMRYKPVGEVFHAQPGSLEYFLTERYCLYAGKSAQIFRCEIDHAPWPLQSAEARIDANTMAQASGIELSAEKPVLQFAGYQDVNIWGLKATE